jgi:hypothetical protein
MESRRLWVTADDRKAFEELKDELDNYQLKITQEGHDQYGALKIGQHDDIASAIGLAAWIAEDFGAANAPLIW